MAYDRDTVKAQVKELAERNVYVSTSSWKYQGWLEQLYNPDRYIYRGKFSKARFERECLSEYAEVFKTVCIDAAYYDFPKTNIHELLAPSSPKIHSQKMAAKNRLN